MKDFIDDNHIESILEQAKNPDPIRVREIIKKRMN